MKKFRIFLAAGLCLLFSLVFFHGKQETVLEFAMFSGSSWDVEVKDSYLVVEEAIAKFEREHPGVRVKYVSGIPKEDYSEWLAGRAMLDRMPDVMMVLDRDFEKLVQLGLLENLEPYVGRDSDFFLEAYYPALLKGGCFGSGRYALPYEAMPYLMFVNKSLLDENHMGMPDRDYTFGDLYYICRSITRDKDGDGDPDHYGIYQYSWQDAALSDGVKLFSDDGKNAYFNQDNLAEAISFVKSLNELHKNQTITREMFDQGQVAFMPLSLAEYRTYRSYPYKIKKYTDFSWDCISMPAGPHGASVSMVDSLNIAMGSGSRHKKLAWEFLKTLTYDREIQSLLYHSMPVASVRIDVMEAPENAQVLSREQQESIISSDFISQVIRQGSPKPKFTAYPGAILLADSEIAKLYTEETDMTNGLRMIQRKIQDYLNQ